MLESAKHLNYTQIVKKWSIKAKKSATHWLKEILAYFWSAFQESISQKFGLTLKQRQELLQIY